MSWGRKGFARDWRAAFGASAGGVGGEVVVAGGAEAAGGAKALDAAAGEA